MQLSESSYLHALIKNIEEAKISRPSREIEFLINSREKEYCLEQLERVGDIKSAIYIISKGFPLSTSHSLKEKLIGYKKSSNRKCPKINDNLSEVLYVGSSTTGVKKRLEQHLGYGHPQTYALHLCHWLDEEVRIQVFEYQSLSRDILQLIEDAISADKIPMFGKKGGNNN